MRPASRKVIEWDEVRLYEAGYKDVEFIEVILSDCEILAKRINRFDDTEAFSLVI